MQLLLFIVRLGAVGGVVMLNLGNVAGLLRCKEGAFMGGLSKSAFAGGIALLAVSMCVFGAFLKA